MARHVDLTEIAGTRPEVYTATPDSMRGREWMVNITRALDSLISKDPQLRDYNESTIHELDTMINRWLGGPNSRTPSGGVVTPYDPENLLEQGWPYQKGPGDYPEPNEG